MLNIESIASKDIYELVTYQQPAPGYTKITLIRGQTFYARCVNNKLQEWTVEETTVDAKKRYDEAVEFEENRHSKLL